MFDESAVSVIVCPAWMRQSGPVEHVKVGVGGATHASVRVVTLHVPTFHPLLHAYSLISGGSRVTSKPFALNVKSDRNPVSSVSTECVPVVPLEFGYSHRWYRKREVLEVPVMRMVLPGWISHAPPSHATGGGGVGSNVT